MSRQGSSARLLIANLHAESDLGGAPPLRGRVMDRISALGTLLAHLGEDGDRVWTPRAVDRRRVVNLPCKVDLVCGPIPEADEMLPWAVTENTFARASGSAKGETLRARLWNAPRSGVGVAHAVNDKRFAAALRTKFGWRLDGESVVDGPNALEAVLDSATEGWVLKGCLSASGRDRVRGVGAADSARRAQARKLLAVHRALIFEPWLERQGDFGVLGLVGDQVEVVGMHGLEVDGRGGFRGVVLDPKIEDGERWVLLSSVEEVGRALQAAGYRGPFGVDVFRFVNDGGVQLRLTSDLNARLSFGFIARAIAERIEGVAALRVGPASAYHRASRSTHNIQLLAPSESDPTSAWVEIRSP